jgi:hypothetical protein
MTHILTYNQIDRQQWSELVQTSETGTWFQSPEAYEFYASMPELMEPFVVGIACTPESDSGLMDEERLRAVCVGYVTKERSAIKQFFTRRAIIIGGPVLAKDATSEEVDALMKGVRQRLEIGDWRLKNGTPIYIETRNFNDFGPWKEAFESAAFAYKPHLNFHFDCTDREAMWARLSETRKRQIHKAQKNGVVIEEAQTEQEIADWYAILLDLYRRKVKTPLFPLSFFLAFFRQKRGIYLLVKEDGKVIGGIMCPIKEEQCIYEWFVCGMDTRYKAFSPSVMATWAAMEYAHTHHLARFDIMGAGEPGVPYGVRDFKAEFGGQLVEHGRFIYICKPMLYRIGTCGVKILKNR